MHVIKILVIKKNVIDKIVRIKLREAGLESVPFLV